MSLLDKTLGGVWCIKYLEWLGSNIDFTYVIWAVTRENLIWGF